jgi:hypothetical protein
MTFYKVRNVTQYNMALYIRWPSFMIISSQGNTNTEHIQLCAQLHSVPHFWDEHLGNNFKNIFISNQPPNCCYIYKFPVIITVIFMEDTDPKKCRESFGQVECMICVTMELRYKLQSKPTACF